MRLYRGDRSLTLQIGGSFFVLVHRKACGIRQRVQTWSGSISHGGGVHLFGWAAIVNIVRTPTIRKGADG